MKALWCLAVAVIVIGCEDPPALPGPTNAPKPSASASSPRPAPSTAPSAPPTRTTSPIRDNTTVGPIAAGAALELRLFVSRVTTKDPISVAIRLRAEGPVEKGHPWLTESFNWSDVLPELRFEIDGPGGKRTLGLADKPKHKQEWHLSDFAQQLEIDGAGVAQGTERLAWKTPEPALLEKPGKYTLTIAGDFKTSSQTMSLTAKPIEIEIVEPGDARKPLADLEKAASAIAAQKVAAPFAEVHAPIVDDVDGNVWFRFQAHSAGRHYDIEVVEVLLDPGGKELLVDVYSHFTCVAEGTLVATPDGDVPIESLAIGQQVTAFDVQAGRATAARVEHVEVSHADQLLDIGALRVTGSHPIFVDGRWQRADTITRGARLLGPDGKSFEADPIPSHVPTTVYDISVSEPHTFFAGGVLVHNKAAHVPLGGAQPWRGWFYRRAAKR